VKSFELRTLDMRKLLATIVVWYFIIFSNGVSQIGPFATQAACNTFRTSLGPLSEFVPVITSTCFSTTAKQ
jgi:hypothetical protein